MRKMILAPIVFALLATGCAFHGAQLPPLIPRAILFGNPAKTDPQISPDGKYLSYLAPDEKNVLQIWVRSSSGLDAAGTGTIVRERQGQPWRVERKWHPAEF